MKNNQAGFGILEVIAVAVITGFLGLSVWYVVNKQPKRKVVNQPSQVENNDTKSSTVDNQSTKENKSFLSIKEWGVKIPLSTIDAGVYYVATSNMNQDTLDPTHLTIYSTETDNLTGPTGMSCKGEYIAFIMRLPKDDPRWQPSQSIDDGNVPALFGERTVINDYRYAMTTKKQYGPECFAISKAGDYKTDDVTMKKFNEVVEAFKLDFMKIQSN